jgi:hypothetical protein
MATGNTPFPLKPYSIGELAEKYSVSRRVFNRWLKPFRNRIGERLGRYYTVTQVVIILKALGMPGQVDEMQF